MDLNDILTGKKSARLFYAELHGTTVQDAANERLKLRQVAAMAARPVLPTGEAVDYATALCFICLQSLMAKYARKYKPDDGTLSYMAKQMSAQFPDWSVLDLPTFVDMCACSRIPTMRLGETEYELVVLDIPSIMSKVEAYDKMRPNKQALQGPSPMTTKEREWDPDLEHKLFDGTPHDFPSVEAAKRYWRSMPDMSNPGEKKVRDRAGTQLAILS